jgi:hypothetical protein
MNDELYYFVDAHNDDDLSDGAWMQVLKDAVSYWNADHKTNLDEHDTVQEYLSRKAEAQKH